MNPCNKEKQIQPHQKFIKNWFSKKNKLLVFHGLGSGKTMSSIFAANALLKQNKVNKIYVITPASLRKNFEKELLSNLSGYKKIPEQFEITSYKAFLNAYKKKMVNLQNSLIIVDEVQNIVSDKGVLYKGFYHILVNKAPKNLRVILMSGTPMFDRAHEIGLTVNLLNPKVKIPIDEFYDIFRKGKSGVKNEELFLQCVYPYVSAFIPKNDGSYPIKREENIFVPMSALQQKNYNKIMNKTNLNKAKSLAFLTGPRIVSNITYHNNGHNLSKRPSDTSILKHFQSNLKLYSPKFEKCISILKEGKQAFVYSNFVSVGGINDFEIALQSKGILSYGIFRTGKEEENKKLVQNFNAGLIQIIIGSPAMKEGISLLKCRQVHILEPYWNNSRTKQIIGRAIRYCSHSELPRNERNVQVYHYISTIPQKKSVDVHIQTISEEKNKLIKKFETLLYKAAVDCPLFHNETGVNKKDCYSSNVHKNIEKGSKKKKKRKSASIKLMGSVKQPRVSSLKMASFPGLRLSNKLKLKKTLSNGNIPLKIDLNDISTAAKHYRKTLIPKLLTQ